MKKWQTIKDEDGNEVIGFPMEHMNITQGNNGSFSHQNANALDNAGKDTGIDEVYCPVTLRFMWADSAKNGNAIFLESTHRVKWADGTLDYASFMFIHDNYIQDIINLSNQGHIFKQGEPISDEGTAGFATGNHCHIEVKKGRLQWNKYNCGYYQLNNKGVYQLQDSVSSDLAFVIDGTVLHNNGQTSNGNKMHWKKSNEIKPTLEVGFVKEKAKFICEVDLLNVRDKPSLSGKVVAQYQKGQFFYYDGYVKREGYVWCHYISFSGKDRWVAVREIKTNRAYGKFI